MNGRMNNLRKRIERLNKKTVARDEGGLAQYLTQERLAAWRTRGRGYWRPKSRGFLAL